MFKYQLDNITLPGFNPSGYFQWLKKVIVMEKRREGNIFYHFCSDDFLLEINRAYLQHDYFTDIITFPLSKNQEILSGEIFISLDRIRENAKTLHFSFETELARVMVHGILHLIGYDDHTDAEKMEMRAKEDYYLSLLASK